MQWIRHGVFGPWNSGKTWFMATLFDSEFVAPDKVLYIDNHHSTNALDLPQHSEVGYGVKHYDFEQADELAAAIDGLYAEYKSTGLCKFEAIAFDDVSEHELVSFDAAESEFKGDKRQLWGQHGQGLAVSFRKLYSLPCHVLIAARAGWKPDPRRRPPPQGQPDNRPMKQVPAIRGMFANWLPHEPDFFVYCDYELDAADNMVFYQQYKPVGDILVKNRHMHKPAMVDRLDDPTFDKVWRMCKEL